MVNLQTNKITMQKLKIDISHARLTEIHVSFAEEDADNHTPKVWVKIGLYTKANQKISEYTINTDGWNDEQKFKLPFECAPHITELAQILEGVAVRKANGYAKALPAPAVEVV